VKVWIAQRHCLDYYCGCGGGHIVGVFESEADAHEALKVLGMSDFDIKYLYGGITEVVVGEARWTPSPGAEQEYHAWT
jgi:hypothetical protein